MGMFDYIKFRYRMPDGFDGFDGDQYQSKDLDCSLDQYEITPCGKLVRTYGSGYPDDVQRPLSGVYLTGVLNICNGVGRKAHVYDLVFRLGALVSIRCHQTDSDLLFEPDTAARETSQDHKEKR